MNNYIAIIRDNHSKNSVIRKIYENLNTKEDVKKQLLIDFVDLFPNGKVYQKFKNDEYVYALIYELDDYWYKYWTSEKECLCCGKKVKVIEQHNMGIHSDYCCIDCEKSDLEKYNNSFKNNLIYIYKITQKSTNKCYIGKTKNHFIWRWWEHLKADRGTKFHDFLKNADMTDLTFEVLEVLPNDTEDKEVFMTESEYILYYNSINNGFNTTISNKDVKENNNLCLKI